MSCKDSCISGVYNSIHLWVHPPTGLHVHCQLRSHWLRWPYLWQMRHWQTEPQSTGPRLPNSNWHGQLYTVQVGSDSFLRSRQGFFSIILSVMVVWYRVSGFRETIIWCGSILRRTRPVETSHGTGNSSSPPASCWSFGEMLQGDSSHITAVWGFHQS